MVAKKGQKGGMGVVGVLKLTTTLISMAVGGKGQVPRGVRQFSAAALLFIPHSVYPGWLVWGHYVCVCRHTCLCLCTFMCAFCHCAHRPLAVVTGPEPRSCCLPLE